MGTARIRREFVTALSHSFRSLRPNRISSFVIALACAIALLYVGRVLLITLSVALILAFMLEPFVTLLMRLRLPRALASFVACGFAICAVYLVGLGVYTQAAGFVDNIPKYSERISGTVDQIVERVDKMERQVYDLVVPKRFREQQRSRRSRRSRRGASGRSSYRLRRFSRRRLSWCPKCASGRSGPPCSISHTRTWGRSTTRC